MSGIRDVDIGAQYAFTSAVMSEHLQAIVSGDLVKGRSIPKSVLSAARNLFDLTLRQIEHDKDPQNTPAPRMRALTMECLVIDMLQKVNGKAYYPSTGEFERDVRQCSELLHEIPDRIRHDENQYLALQRFFNILNKKAVGWEYDHAMCGSQSPYTASLGW